MMTGPVSVAPDCRSRRRSGHHDHRSTRSSRTGLGDHVQSERVVMSGRNPQYNHLLKDFEGAPADYRHLVGQFSNWRIFCHLNK